MTAINGTENEKAFISEELYEKLSKVSGKLEEGDILVTGGGSVGNPYIVPDNKPLYTKDADLLWIKNKGKFHPYFLYEFFFSPTFRNYLGSISHVGTIAHYTITQLSDTPIGLPIFEEQKEVGEYFQSLDRLITLHQRKCEQTKKLKKYMLQKMFPRNGAKVPEIRFDGFTYDWEQRKFSDIASRESVSRESSYDLPSLEYEDVIAEEGRLNKDISLKENIKKGIVFDGSQVLYGKLRPYLHNWLNPDFSGVAVGDWWVLKPNNADKSFIYRLIQTQRFDDIANQSAGSKMPRADWNLVSNTEFAVPVSQEEQEKIGEYFSSLDHLITLHQRKCDELKKMKKYMLQNMFI